MNSDLKDKLKKLWRSALSTAVSLLMVWAVAQFRMFATLETRVIRAEERLAQCEKKVKAQTEARLHE